MKKLKTFSARLQTKCRSRKTWLRILTSNAIVSVCQSIICKSTRENNLTADTSSSLLPMAKLSKKRGLLNSTSRKFYSLTCCRLTPRCRLKWAKQPSEFLMISIWFSRSTTFLRFAPTTLSNTSPRCTLWKAKRLNLCHSWRNFSSM